MNKDGRVYLASRVVNFPIDGGTLGHYSAAATTGIMAAGLGADSDIMHFWWTSSIAKAVIYSIRCTGMYATTAFAAGPILLSASIARSWTGAGSGGTTVSVFTDRQKLDTSFGSSIVNVIRISTTAALGAGTKTTDPAPIGQLVSHSSGGVSSATPIIGSIYIPNNGMLFKAEVASGEAPITLNSLEGLVLKATVPGTGVWVAGFEIKWCEVPHQYTRS